MDGTLDASYQFHDAQKARVTDTVHPADFLQTIISLIYPRGLRRLFTDNQKARGIVGRSSIEPAIVSNP